MYTGDRIVSASDDGTAKVWATATAENLLTLGHGPENEDDEVGLLCCAFSTDPDGWHVLTGGGDSTAIMCDSRSWDKQMTFRGHTLPVGYILPISLLLIFRTPATIITQHVLALFPRSLSLSTAPSVMYFV